MSSNPRTLRWVHPPRQDRSRRTLDRILDAAERLLVIKSFDELTIAEVVRRSRSSVGAFYARFPDKGVLLAAVYERHQQQAVATAHAMFDPARWAKANVRELVGALVRFLVKLYREKRGLMRALVLHGYTHPDWRYADPKERERLALARVGALIAAHRDEIQHPDPKLAGSLGLLMVLATLREKILFAESTSSAVRIDDHRLADELTRAYTTYLGIRDVAPKGN